jgi:hypothetical protein
VPTLRSLTIQNFKAIGDPVKIEFKPITLLFGPNNAGKSTIIQALAYVRELFVNRNPDPQRIVVRGEQIDLGGFRAAVHNQDPSLTMAFGVEMDLDGGLPQYMPEDTREWVSDEAGICLDCLKKVSRISVDVSLFWDKAVLRPYVGSYTVSLNNEEFGGISAPFRRFEDYSLLDRVPARKYDSACPWINLEHSVFDAADGGPQRKLLMELADLVIEDPSRLRSPVDETDPLNHIAVTSAADALLDWDRRIELDWSDFKEFEEINLKEGQYAISYIKAFSEVLSQTLAGPGKIIRDTLLRMRHLGPLRAMPPRILEQSQLVEEAPVSSGLGVWEELFREDMAPEISNINEWMAASNRLDIGYELNLKHYRELNSQQMKDLEASQVDERHRIISEIRAMPVRTRLSLRKVNSKQELSLRDVGTGVSQVMPVVIAALIPGDTIVTIEQPELHIHPALQVKLGDLFLSRIQKDPVLFILETHSEHLLLRIMRRMRETAEGKLPDGRSPVYPKDVIVLFVEPDDSRTIIREMPLNERGELVKAWPGGFFEEGLREVF